jgi:hypothetical protein
VVETLQNPQPGGPLDDSMNIVDKFTDAWQTGANAAVDGWQAGAAAMRQGAIAARPLD